MYKYNSHRIIPAQITFARPIMRSITVLYVVAATIVATVAAEYSLHTQLSAPANNCASINHITDDQLAVLKQANPIVIHRNYKCFIRCLADRMQIFLPGGLLDIDRIVEISELSGTDGDALRAKAGQCLADLPVEVTSCEEAYTIFRCIFINKLRSSINLE